MTLLQTRRSWGKDCQSLGEPSTGWKWGQGGFFEGAVLVQMFVMGDEAGKRHFLLGTLF